MSADGSVSSLHIIPRFRVFGVQYTAPLETLRGGGFSALTSIRLCPTLYKENGQTKKVPTRAQ